MATRGAGASFIAIPAAADAQAAIGFRFDAYAIRHLSGLARALPALATGAALTGDGLVQQVLALRQAAITGAAGMTGRLSRIQPLMPALTL